MIKIEETPSRTQKKIKNITVDVFCGFAEEYKWALVRFLAGAYPCHTGRVYFSLILLIS